MDNIDKPSETAEVAINLLMRRDGYYIITGASSPILPVKIAHELMFYKDLRIYYIPVMNQETNELIHLYSSHHYLGKIVRGSFGLLYNNAMVFL